MKLHSVVLEEISKTQYRKHQTKQHTTKRGHFELYQFDFEFYVFVDFFYFIFKILFAVMSHYQNLIYKSLQT